MKAELKRASEERDFLKKGRRVLCQNIRVTHSWRRTKLSFVSAACVECYKSNAEWVAVGITHGETAHNPIDNRPIQRFWCKDNELRPGMSRRGNCWVDLGFCHNAVAESFFSSLKKERIKRQIHASRQEAQSDIFDYIEGFNNRVRRHNHLDQLSPLAFEQLQFES